MDFWDCSNVSQYNPNPIILSDSILATFCSRISTFGSWLEGWQNNCHILFMMSTLIELLSHFVPFHSICQSLKSTRLCYFTASFKHHLTHTVVTHLWLRCSSSKFNCEPALRALWWARYGNVNLLWWVLWFLSSTAMSRKTFQQLFGFFMSRWVWKMFEIYSPRWRIVLEVRKSVARIPYS